MRWVFAGVPAAISLMISISCSQSDCAVGETACIEGDVGGDQDAGQGGGSAPVISELTYSPDTGTAGTQITISGSFMFTDADGDVSKVATGATPPGGAFQEGPVAEIQGAGKTQGQAMFILALLPTVAGEYTFEVWLIDAAGNASNRLSGTVTVE
ncbi:MAG: hypothetical protein HY897_12615 [Deltaproteobacteria bacterium]|nr:hypothetical protein [Deltaproteobacteria bacterium]